MRIKFSFQPTSAILLGLMGLMIFPLAGCIRKCNIPPGGYIFVLPHTVAPVRTVYKVGDTISISADFSHHVKDVYGDSYLLEDFNFSLSFALLDLQDSNIFSSAVRAFSTCEILLEEDTNLFLDNIGPRGEYNYADGRYRLGFKFRPLKPGFYALMQKSLTYRSSLGNEAKFPGRCDTRGSVGAIVDVNNGASNNYHLIQDEHYEGATYPWRVNEKNFHEDGVFLFYVEE
jgi:hypothetical protein